MFQFNKFINSISFTLITGTGVLFLIKYGWRVMGGWSIIPALLFAASIWFIAGWAGNRFQPMKIIRSRGKIYPLLVYLGVIFTFGMLLLDLDSRVGRYYAINEWLESFNDGRFPYGGVTNPSGFPVLFLLALPFYYLGNTGMMVPLGIALLAGFVIYEKKTYRDVVVSLTILFLSPLVSYEYLTRSELIFNMSLAVILISLTADRRASEQREAFHYVMAAAWGAILATRLAVAIPWALFLLFFYRQDLKRMITSGAVAIGVFTALVIPFWLWNPELFMQKGPFAIQMMYLPLWVYILTPVVILAAGWLAGNHQEVYFSAGIILFGLVLVSFFSTAAVTGFEQAIFRDRFDVSYFILPLPFFIMAIREYTVDRYLGRVYYSEPEQLELQ
ncbi:MAG: hypothetical protein FMNOHCHN_00168 [Ignavibacteriaceae bacterium]|nr:hypothetical protein [Ignavibacteriaceae bacterium]